MPATLALVFALVSVMLVGMIVLLTGAVQIVTARRRDATVRAPVVATGVGLALVLAAGITLGGTGVLHTTDTFQTFTATH